MKHNRWQRALLTVAGLRHALALPFWIESEIPVVLALFRAESRSDFSRKEIADAKLLHAHIEMALRRLEAVGRSRVTRLGLERILSTLPVPTLLLDWNAEVLYENAAARDVLAGWAGAGHLKRTKRAIPAAIIAIISEMKTALLHRNGDDLIALTERLIEHPSGKSARITAMALRPQHSGRPCFRIRFEEGNPAEHRGLAALIRLSVRQRELAVYVVAGLSNQEIASRLGRSLNTIKTELHSVFKRLAVHSRAQLILRMREGEKAKPAAKIRDRNAQSFAVGAKSILPVRFSFWAWLIASAASVIG